MLVVQRIRPGQPAVTVAQAGDWLSLVTLLLRQLSPKELNELKLTRIGREQERMHHPDAVMPTDSPKPAKKGRR